MGIRTSIVVLVIVGVAISVLPKKTEAVNHVVGDSIGWTIPPESSSYSSWASNRSFYVGDILVFNYGFGIHDFAEVTRQNYELCNATEPIRLGTIGYINYSLDTPGDYYFICTFPLEYSRGQKLAIHVLPPLAPDPAPLVNGIDASPSLHVRFPSPSPTFTVSNVGYSSSPTPSPVTV